MLVQRRIVRLDLFIYRNRLYLAIALIYISFIRKCTKMSINYINIKKADGYRKTKCPTLNLKVKI